MAKQTVGGLRPKGQSVFCSVSALNWIPSFLFRFSLSLSSVKHQSHVHCRRVSANYLLKASKKKVTDLFKYPLFDEEKGLHISGRKHGALKWEPIINVGEFVVSSSCRARGRKHSAGGQVSAKVHSDL